MARLKSKKREMKDFFALFLFFQCLCQICHSLETVESHSQAFIQTDTNHLTYIVGDVSSGIPIEVQPGHVYNVRTDDLLYPSLIQLDPPMLDFQEQPVGMPRMEQVTVRNTDRKNNLHLLSISGSTAHFHCSFFQDKIVPPDGNTTFDVVFLARQEGNVENTLYIHTSVGSFKYQVFGVGIPNPYRLRPYLGARVPVNTSFSPLINMHNPHSSTLQVLEMFSSEGDLHLELPTGEKEAPKSLWEIPPYETKTVMKANFIGRTENNHTAFIRIKTNQKQDTQLLVLPIEVEVTSSPGIYAAQELIDFGILRTLDEPKVVAVNLINTGNTAVQITSVTVSPPNDAISVDFRPTKIQPELLRQTTIAYVTFKASKAIHPKFWSGKIIVRSKNNLYKIAIPYQATVLHGSLAYYLNMTSFYAMKDLHNYSHPMTFTNTFNFSVVIYNISLPTEIKNCFSVINFSQPVIIHPQKTVTVFLLRYHPKEVMQHFRAKLMLHTNASIFEIPITVYNAQLKIIPHRPEKFEGQLDFGTMGVRENRSILFTLINDNPIELYVDEYSTDMKGASIQVLGIEKGNGTTLTRPHNLTLLNNSPLILQPYHFAVLSLNLVAPEEEGSYQAEVIIATAYQDTFMPVLVRTAEGSLHAIPDKIIFHNVYPGKVPYKVLQIHSTFEEQMEVTRVAFEPPDSRFYFERMGKDPIILEPQKNNIIGKIYFDSKRECKEECYVGLPTYTPAGHQWLLGFSLDHDTPETDKYLYNYLRQKWERVKQLKQNTANVTIELDTGTVQGFLFSAQAHLHWPDIIRKSNRPYKFPLTQIGNISISSFVVENPGDIPVLVQIFALPVYPNPQAILDLVGKSLPPYFSEYVETEDEDIFVITEIPELNPIPDSTINQFRRSVDHTFGIKTHKQSIAAVLGGGAKVKIEVGFQPKDDSLKTSLIIVRNNLTIIDILVLEGQGGRGEMKLNNRKPGASTLQFDIAEKHLKNCDKKKHSKNLVPNFTVKRSFTLKNTGELPFYVHGYNINDAFCEGYGFRVLDCEGYEMSPNTSRKIDIAFTPDFTMSRIRRTLTVFTSLGSPFNYTLQATVPPHTLAKCAASLPRPNWEPVLYYSILCVMAFLLFCVLLASYFEADRIFVADILRRKVKLSNGAPIFQKDKVFDLKTIGTAQNHSQSPQTKPVTPVQEIQKAPPITTNPRPIIEITGPEADSKSFWTVLKIVLMSLFVQQPSSTKKRTDRENNNIEKQDAMKTASKRVETITPLKSEKEPDPHHETIVAEKYSSTQQKPVLRKAKAAKRGHSDFTHHDTTGLTPFSGHIERKQGNKTVHTSNSDKKTADYVGTSKEKTTPILTNDSNPFSAPRHSDVGLDDFATGKQKNKRKGKGRQDNDIITKDRLTRTDCQEDRDETSSTTTESSTGDGDEKSSSARDSTPEPPPLNKPKKTKNKARNLPSLMIPRAEDELNDDDFELNTKSRAYKKIRCMNGGDVIKNSNLEDIDLPYTMDEKKKVKKKETVGTKKTPKLETPRIKGDIITADVSMDTLDALESDRDSPAPQWDEPLPLVTDDLSELSIQTDQFARKHIKPTLDLGPQPSISPDGLTNSSRSSSYSSIVSSSSGDGNNKSKDKRYPTGFSPYSDALTAPRTPPVVNTGSSSKMRNPWGAPASSPSTPDPIGFGLQTIQESSRPGNTLTDKQVDTFTQPGFSFGTSVTSSPSEPNYSLSPGFEAHSQNMTMMQRLQHERRRRILEYNQRKTGEDWPGFDVPPTSSDSLWDSAYNPLETGTPWSLSTVDTSATTQDTGLWNTLTNSANSGWSSLMSIWGGTSTSPVDLLSSDNSFMTPDTSANSSGQTPEPVGTFNPFGANIWRPSASTAPSGWNLPTPTPAPSQTPTESTDNMKN